MIDLIVGQTYEIPRREPNGEASLILRAYARPRGQEAVGVEMTDKAVTVTALSPGYALVDVVDAASEPTGTDYEFYVRAVA